MRLDTAGVERLIPAGESLTVELKGEQHGSIADREIYETVVCLANTEGGVLLVGIENDGTVTGARPRHGASTDPQRLQAAIFNNTAPPINTRVSLHAVEGDTVLAIEVDAYPEVCATREGRCLRRVIGVQGPECQPFYPYEHASRRGDLGLLDYSAQLVDGATWADFDPLEIVRLRQTIEQRRGDRALLPLDDREMIQALQLVETSGGELLPNVAGLLLLGREDVLRRALPTHAIAFQVLDQRTDVLVNAWFYGPLIKTLESVEERFAARNDEQEVQIGMFRLPVPAYAPEAFREAVLNAMQHRDYARLGAVHIQLHPEHLKVTNPGGFVEGITLENLLVHEPKPRNPRLTEALRRSGLVETTGRGIDRIYLGQLRYGRTPPDYSASAPDAVRLVLSGGPTGIAFAAFVYEETRAGRLLTLDELLVLDHLLSERRINSAVVGRLTQRGEPHARGVLERLVEKGLIQARGERRGRIYHLSAPLYRRLGVPAGYVRAHGFDTIQQESMVLQYVQAHGRVTRRDVAELCQLEGRQASHLLRKMTDSGKLVAHGERRWTFYTANSV